MTGLESRVSARRGSGPAVLVDLALDLELEALALTDIGDAVEAEAGQRLHRLALRVEDLGLEHDVDDDAGHGHSCQLLGAVRLAAYWRRGLGPAARRPRPGHRSHRIPARGRRTDRYPREPRCDGRRDSPGNTGAYDRAMTPRLLPPYRRPGGARRRRRPGHRLRARRDDTDEAGAATSTAATSTPASASTDPCAQGQAADLRRRQADDRHRQAGLRAVVRRRQAGERQGLRGCGRRGGGDQARLHRRRRSPGSGSPFNSVFKPTPKNWDFDINEFSITEERKQARGLLLAVLRREPGGRHDQGLQGGRRHRRRRPQGADARRPGRHHQLRGDQRGDRPDEQAAGLQQQQRRGEGPRERPDRRAGHRPADRVLHGGRPAGQGQDRRPAAVQRRDAGAVRPGAGQGQPADRLRQPGRSTRCGPTARWTS